MTFYEMSSATDKRKTKNSKSKIKVPSIGLHKAFVLRLGLPPFTYQFYWVAASKP